MGNIRVYRGAVDGVVSAVERRFSRQGWLI